MKESVFKNMPIIQAKNLGKSYPFYKKEKGFGGAVKSFFARKTELAHAVKDISFSIEEGEVVGFLGPNGAGKTTTLKMLSGITTPSKGEARVLGFEPGKREYAYQRQFSIVMGQKNQLFQDLPPIETFAFNKDIYGIPEKEYQETLAELIEILGVEEILYRQARKLSLGQRMKCELIAALLHRPKILFLDEPTIGLDVVAQKNIRDFLKKYNQEHKTTIMLTSHYMEDIRELCERVIVISEGRLIYDGGIDKLIADYAPYKFIKVTFNQDGAKKETVALYGEVVEYNQYRVVLQVPRKKARQVAADILNGELPVDDIFLDEEDIDAVIREIFNKNEII